MRKGRDWWKTDAMWSGRSVYMCGENRMRASKKEAMEGRQDKVDGGNTNFSNAKKLVQQVPML